MDTLLSMLWLEMDSKTTPHRDIILRGFRLIKDTPELKKQYLRVCQAYERGKHFVNPRIAREIKLHYRLETTGNRFKVTDENALIESYSELR